MVKKKKYLNLNLMAILTGKYKRLLDSVNRLSRIILATDKKKNVLNVTRNYNEESKEKQETLLDLVEVKEVSTKIMKLLELNTLGRKLEYLFMAIKVEKKEHTLCTKVN